MINKQMLMNAMEMTIQDYVTDEDDITVSELHDVKTRVGQLISTLANDASDDKDEDDN